jgi:hypothetical protein
VPPRDDVALVALTLLERARDGERLPWPVLTRARLVVCFFAMHARIPIPFYEVLDGLEQSYFDEMLRAKEPGERPDYRGFPKGRRRSRF